MPPDAAAGTSTPSPLDWLNSQLAERPQDAGLWYGKGVLLAKEGDLDGALKAFDRVLWLDPDHVKAMEAKGRALFRTERYLEALEVFRRLTEKVPRDEEYWYYSGECLARVGRPEKAVPYYEKALEINPNYTDAWYGRGNAMKRAGLQPERTESAPVEEATPVEEGGPDLRETMGQAESAYYAGDYERALALYDEVLAADEGATAAWAGKGKALTRLGRYGDAADCYERGLTGRSQDAETWLRRAQALREEGDLEEALDSLDMALRLDPRNVAVQMERGEVQADLEAQREPEPAPAPEPVSERALPPVATHIPTLDRALGGGVPPGSLVLVTGMPGTFKTSLCFWILYQQCVREGTRALYVTAEQSKESLLRHVTELGLRPPAVAEDLRILDLAAYRREFVPRESSRDWLTFLEEKLREARRAGTEILALDSLQALRGLVGLRDRKELYRLFDFVRSLEVTAFLVDERMEVEWEGQVLRAHDAADFLADGILELTHRQQADGEVKRGLRVAKMRERAHPLSLYTLTWDGGVRLTQALEGLRA